MLAMPALCWLCRMPLRIARHGLCSLCLRGLPPLPLLCPRCGLPAATATAICGRCRQHAPAWQALVCVNDYRPPFSEWVNQLKFSHITALRVMLARLLLLSWQPVYRRGGVPRPDLLLPVPLHQRRRWQRGYNQTGLLAAPLAHWLGCEWCEELSRPHRGALQHQLRAHQRRTNLRGAFRLEREVQGRHIALLDDVITTGSTVDEISRLLLAQGAASVQVWCLCRTL